MGKVYLVGAGPGDPRLITTYGKELIEKADCIVYDRLIGIELLDYAKNSCEKIYVGKENHKHIVPQADIENLLLKKSKQCPITVRLKGGDPYVFGRGGEEALFLKNNNVDVEIVPGVTSAISALTYAGIPITHRGISKGFRVITAHSKQDILSNIDFNSLLSEDETLVFLMGLHHLGEIANALIKAGRNPHTPAAVISNATTPTQKKCIGTLSNIENLASEAELVSPATIVVGDVVKLNCDLSFFESRPLFGKCYLVPYIKGINYSFKNGLVADNQSTLVNKLKELGAEVVTYNTGKIKPVNFNVDIIKNADVLAFTSQNAVCSFMSQIGDIRNIGSAKIAVVGKKTAELFTSFGITPDIMSKKGTAEDLAAMLNLYEQVIHFSAKQGANSLGDNVVQIPCYENVPTNFEFNDDISNCDAVIFTCGSNAQKTIKATNGNLPKQVLSIGTSCSRVLKDNGITNFIEAKTPSIEALIDILK